MGNRHEGSTTKCEVIPPGILWGTGGQHLNRLGGQPIAPASLGLPVVNSARLASRLDNASAIVMTPGLFPFQVAPERPRSGPRMG